MSEYQYYEWQTIDRPLSPDEREAVSRLSSHMETVTSTHAIVSYSWGSFKHKPRQVLLQYFDAHLYQANWGTRVLLFRFPKAVIDPQAVLPYCRDNFLSLDLEGDYYILEFSPQDDEPDGDWVEAEGDLDRLIPIREQIIQGDYRALYLGWLKAITLEYDVDEVSQQIEPPVPAGLGKLHTSQQAFIRFFDLDEYLVAAAAKASPELQPASTEPLDKALLKLTRQECVRFLRQVLNGDSQVRVTLQKRLAQLAGTQPASLVQGQRQAGELLQEAERILQEAERQQQVEVERKRVQALLDLAKREESTWRWVESLIEQKQARPYDEATQLLINLRDLAIYQDRLPGFQTRVQAIKAKYGSRPSLMDRFKRAGL